MVSINDDDSNQKSKKDYDTIIEELEKELAKKQVIIQDLNERVHDANNRVSDMVEKNSSLESRINEYELQDLAMKFGKFEALKDNNKKLDHRVKVTKKHLDNAREYLKFTDIVILDMKNRSTLDRILRRYPDSYLRYVHDLNPESDEE
jgi:chromosome segregation ATPase